MVALLDKLALVEDDNLVGEFYGVEPVSDDERRAAFEQLCQTGLEQALMVGVQVGGGFV